MIRNTMQSRGVVAESATAAIVIAGKTAGAGLATVVLGACCAMRLLTEAL